MAAGARSISCLPSWSSALAVPREAARGMEQSARGKEESAKGKEQRAKGKEQKANGKRQKAISNWQYAINNEEDNGNILPFALCFLPFVQEAGNLLRKPFGMSVS